MDNQALRRRHPLNKEYTAVLLSVAIPVMLQNMISLGLNLVDVLMIGWVGTQELAAVGAANRIYSVFGMLCFGLVSGSAVYVAQFWGQRDIKNIRRVYGLALTACSILALVVLIVCFAFPRPLLHLFVREDAVLDIGQRYLRIALFSYPLIALSFATSFNCRAIRRLTGPTIISATALGFSTLLRYGLIFGNWGFPQLGVEGAAIATVAGRALEFVLLMLLLYRSKDHPLAGKPSELFSFPKTLRRKVWRTTMPIVANDGCLTLGVTVFYIAVGFLGTSAVAAMQVASVMNDFFQAIFYGVGNAVAVLTGNELGRGNKENAYSNGKTALFATAGLALVIGGLMLLARGTIVRLYGFDAVTSAMLSGALVSYSLLMLPRMLLYVLICGLLRAGGDTRFCMIVDVSCLWLIGVPLSFIGALLLHLSLPIVLAMVLAGDVVACLLCLRRFRSKVWINTLI